MRALSAGSRRGPAAGVALLLALYPAVGDTADQVVVAHDTDTRTPRPPAR